MKLISFLTRLTLGVFCLSCANAKVLSIEHWKTKNGAEVLFVPSPSVPMLDVLVAFDAGSSRDASQPGIAALTNAMIDQGSSQFNATQIAEAFEDQGAQYSVSLTRDMAVLGLRSLSQAQHLEPALSMFTHIINQANFPESAFERERKQQLQAIRLASQSPKDVANQQFFQSLYGNLPYAHSSLGTKDSVQQLNRSQLNAFHKQYYVAENATIALVGAIDSQQAHQIAEKLTAQMPRGKKARALTRAPNLTQPATKNIKFPSSQTIIRIGQMGITHHSQDYFPLMVGNYTLGGGTLVSRLAKEVREDRGLTYGISSQFVPLAGRGPFLISLGTKNNQAQQAMSVSMETLNQFLHSGPSQNELKAAKQYINGSFPLRFDSNRAIANTLLSMGFYQLPLDYLDQYLPKVNAVTIKQIQSAFQKHIDPKKMVTITVGRV